ncbi:MAG: multidrug ABC transporter ATP-binding protein [Chloroflexi bacterium HGW-Chloroflexi-10]|nr:MAG: multidrug ABC transporter ATP-binding protein [Chloroflexi bacterium HGW-Chloroflexi-10]
MNVITVENLKKSYGDTHAVADISFSVQRGEIFGIVGPNGAGKTTTVECLAGLRRATSGSIRVLGLDPQREERAVRRLIGVQLQQSALPDDIRVWEALDLFASFYPHPLDWHVLLNTWGLAEKSTARFNTLSGGQKQRLFIALALVHNPELVILDELTTGLDPQARHATWDLIERLRAEGKTVVLVTHFMDEAERLCDRIAIIDHGKLVALDSPKTLIHSLNADMRLRFADPSPRDWSLLQTVEGVNSVERRNGDVVVSGGANLLVNVVTKMNEIGYQPVDLRSEAVTLEDVFLSLTGREIRAND